MNSIKQNVLMVHMGTFDDFIRSNDETLTKSKCFKLMFYMEHLLRFYDLRGKSVEILCSMLNIC